MSYNPNLDWKKVFKKFLIKEKKLEDNSRSEDRNSSAKFEAEVVEELGSSSEQDYISSEFSESKSKLPQSVSSLRVSNESLNEEKNILTHEAELDSNDDILCSPGPSFCFKNRRNKSAPEWNNIFKEILGYKQFKDDLTGKSGALPSTKDMNKQSPQKQDERSKYSARRKINRSVPRYNNKSDEETKVRAEFVNWARVRKPNNEYKLNDFDGAGINIFKDGMMKDVSLQSRPYEKDFHLTGFIAVKPYTKADVRNNSQDEISEAWDDDLLF